MALSKCSGCKSVEMFEIDVKTNMIGAARPVAFVQCAACGTVVGALPEVDASVLVAKLRDEVRELTQLVKRR